MNKRQKWNIRAVHPLQSWEWGEFRLKTGVRTVRENGIQITIHKIPHTRWSVGYAPKIGKLNENTVNTLKKVAREERCIFVKVEPKIERREWRNAHEKLRDMGLVEGRPLFTKYNFVLDLTPSENALLTSFKQKTRYNIRLAQKKGVTVGLDSSREAFDKYLQLTEETTERQGFYAHGREYHQKMWETFGAGEKNDNGSELELRAYLLAARYAREIITTWMLFRFKDTFYYPYGASTREHREVMANNLVMWEAIKLAKGWGLKYFDMWGALGPDPDPGDPWYGFHKFKEGYGAKHVEYVGSWDCVNNKLMYVIYKIVEKIRWGVLRIKKRRSR